MLVGYNTNISYKSTVYHIQTEDSGQSNPVIVTLLYLKGAILSSKKTSYAHIADDPDYAKKVREMMREQHKGMIKELLAGKYTGEYEEEEVEEEAKKDKETGGTSAEIVNHPEEKPDGKNQITKSLDDILLNYIMKRSK